MLIILNTNLKEEHERYPLIIAVISLLLAVFIAQTVGSNFCTNLSMLLARYSERISNPAEGIDNMHGHGTITDARNWITYGMRQRSEIKRKQNKNND